MIVGFSITELRGFRKEAIEFIQAVCVLDSPDTAKNIVDSGKGVNVFTPNITLELLNRQPFAATPIYTEEGKHLLTSTINNILEIQHKGKTLRLYPTEYIYVEPSDISSLMQYVEQGVTKFIPDILSDGEVWVLQSGTWNDSGVWIDSDIWRD